jgi:hypothetical protein
MTLTVSGCLCSFFGVSKSISILLTTCAQPAQAHGVLLKTAGAVVSSESAMQLTTDNRQQISPCWTLEAPANTHEIDWTGSVGLGWALLHPPPRVAYGWVSNCSWVNLLLAGPPVACTNQHPQG